MYQESHPTLEPGPVPEGSLRTLAPPQLGILEAEVWSRDPAAYTVVSAVRAEGVPDWNLLVHSARQVLGRHDVLSWHLVLDDGYRLTARATPCAPQRDPVEELDLRGDDAAHADVVIAQRLRCERGRVINLMDPAGLPHARVLLFRTPCEPAGEGDTALCALITHHALVDEFATTLLWSEIFQRATGQAVCDHYDCRYAQWSAASVSDSAAAAARHAAQELAGHLGAHPLGIAEAPPQPGPAPTPLHFTLPTPLHAAAVARAAQLAVPPTAVYGAALSHTLCRRADDRPLVFHLPMTRRAPDVDHDIVGCYVSSVPVLARPPGDCDDRAQAIRRWQASLAFSSARSHADTATLRTALGDRATPRVSLAFEAPSTVRSAPPIRWKPLPAPDSTAKTPLAVFLAPGSRNVAGSGRLLWQHGVLDGSSARDLVATFLTNVGRYARA
ncbi:hypothetical protein [Streptomyces sp. NPDC056061]|uniref:hypothetical protein n=1 Tax=Streptomyces sp. NPDC056061 TaxID=3345700 RepID=UPI0035DC6C50